MKQATAIKALYNPTKGTIGCVLLQAAYGCSSEVSDMFSTSDWILSPEEGMVMMQATAAQWQQLADMNRDERVDRFKRMRSAAP